MRAITLFGADQIQDELADLTKRKGIAFPCPACESEVELVSLLGDGSEFDVIIIYTLVMSLPLEHLLQDIRALTKTIRIIIIEAGKRPVKLSADELEQYQIYDVIPAGKRLDLGLVVDAICQGPLDAVDELDISEETNEFNESFDEETFEVETFEESTTEESVADDDTEQPQEIPVLEPEPIMEQECQEEPLEENPKELLEDIPIPEAAIQPEQPVPLELPRQEEPMSPARARSQRRSYRPRSRLKHTVVGVMSTSHGAGCTSMVSTLAEFFTLCGFASVAIDLTGTKALELAKGKAEYFSGTVEDVNDFVKTFDFVTVDFGVLHNVGIDGQYMGLSSEYGLPEANLFQDCNIKICMGFLDEDWHVRRIQKLLCEESWQKLLGNNFIFMFNRQPDFEEMRYYPMFDRNDPQLGYLMADIFFINEDEEDTE